MRIWARADGRRVLLATIAAAFAVVWVYVALRAYRVPFTDDESITFGIFHGSPEGAGVANNQLLNTVLMQLSQDLFGDSEFALRLPNVLAFAVYAAGSLVLLSRLRRRPAVVLGAALLLGDPLLLDFFGLARGYGLSLAFLAVTLAALGMPRGTWWKPVVACGCSVLAVYASFASLNVVLGVLAVLALEAGRVVQRGSARARATWLLSLAAAVGLLVPAVIRLSWLERTGALYYGGRSGFVRDTIGSLLQGVGYRYTYTSPRPGWLIWPDLAVVTAIVLACAWSFRVGIVRRRLGPAQQAALILLVAVAAVEIEAKTIRSVYPVDRAALTYVLVFAVLIAGAVDEIAVRFTRQSVARVLAIFAAASAAAAAANVAVHANLRYTPIWSRDASERSLVADLIAFARAHPEARPLRLLSFPTDYAIDYYKIRLGMTWLRPQIDLPRSTPNGDLYEVPIHRLGGLPPGTRLVARFPASDFELRARFPLP